MRTDSDYSAIKKLALPPGFSAPTHARRTRIVVARAISRADLSDDVRGINASLELIRRTRGGGWPTEPVTEEFNFVDLVWHELEFRDGMLLHLRRLRRRRRLPRLLLPVPDGPAHRS